MVAGCSSHTLSVHTVDPKNEVNHATIYFSTHKT